MNRLFIRNDSKYRLLRTIIQGIIGVLIAHIDLIVGTLHFSGDVRALIVALTMAVLSPIMASLGANGMEKEELPEDYFEEGSGE